MSEGAFGFRNLAYHVGDNPLHVNQNRYLTCKELGIDISQLVSMDQVHGDCIKMVSHETKACISKCDGILTREKNLALMVQTADCLPLLLYAQDIGVIGALHAGRVGVFEEIVPKALVKLRDELGASMENLHIWIGPAIGQCCYEIGGDILKYARINYGAFVDGNRLDIGGIVVGQLVQNGVRNIYHDETCTACNDKYFSYRREGQTGRQGGIIMLRQSDG